MAAMLFGGTALSSFYFICAIGTPGAHAAYYNMQGHRQTMLDEDFSARTKFPRIIGFIWPLPGNIGPPN